MKKRFDNDRSWSGRKVRCESGGRDLSTSKGGGGRVYTNAKRRSNKTAELPPALLQTQRFWERVVFLSSNSSIESILSAPSFSTWSRGSGVQQRRD